MTPTAVFHGGNVSAYTVDDDANANNAGDLEEYYLPLGSATWAAQDLSSVYKTPAVAAVTAPVASTTTAKPASTRTMTALGWLPGRC